MASKFSHLFICFFFLFSIQPFISHSRTLKSAGQPFNFLQNMEEVHKEEVHKGQTVVGISKVKNYLNRFGYYPNPSDDSNLTDHFDDFLESALKTYQNYYKFKVTGKLDFDTMRKMMTPRCGVPDITNIATSKPFNKFNYTISLYNFPLGMPTWSHYDLTYKFGDNVPDDEGVRSAFSQAFESWATVSRFKFQQVSSDEGANVVIGFYSGDHGDGYPFDGPGDVLAHSFFPENGWSHFDSDEDWSTNPSMTQIDLQSVAAHEFGHILGLAHSQDPDAIMYPYIKPGTIKRDLTQDDIYGLQILYSN